MASDPDGEGADVVTVATEVEESNQPVVETTTPRTSTSIATTTTTLSDTTTTASLLGTRQNPLDPGTTVRVGLVLSNGTVISIDERGPTVRTDSYPIKLYWGEEAIVIRLIESD